MAYDVALVEVVERDPVDAFEHVNRFDQPATACIGQVDLRDIAGDYCLRVKAQTRDEHLHLFGRSVLGFIENDEAVIQRASTHERDRSNLDDIALQITIDFLLVEQIIQSVVERPEIRIDLLLQSARKESETFASLHCRTRQDN